MSAALARARTSAQLHASRARDSALLGAIRDGVLAIDAEGEVLALNQSGAALLGLRRESALGKKLRELPGLAILARMLAETPSQAGEVSLPNGGIGIIEQSVVGVADVAVAFGDRDCRAKTLPLH